jgi:RNA polymerase sigma-70 factor (ECF subfamily)
MTAPDLYTRIQSGDKAACDECVQTYTPMVYGLALKLLGDEAEAEDVTQETFMNAFRAIDNFEWRSEISTWLYRIAYNAAMARLRKRSSDYVSVEELAVRTDGKNVPQQLYDWCCLPERDFEIAQTRQKLEKAIGSLPESLKSVFVLRILENLSTRDSAQTLGISEDNVKTRLRRARLFLQNELTQ